MYLKFRILDRVIHPDFDVRSRPGQSSLALHSSCRGDLELYAWDLACKPGRTAVRNKKFLSGTAADLNSNGPR